MRFRSAADPALHRNQRVGAAVFCGRASPDRATSGSLARPDRTRRPELSSRGAVGSAWIGTPLGGWAPGGQPRRAQWQPLPFVETPQWEDARHHATQNSLAMPMPWVRCKLGHPAVVPEDVSYEPPTSRASLHV